MTRYSKNKGSEGNRMIILPILCLMFLGLGYLIGSLIPAPDFKSVFSESLDETRQIKEVIRYVDARYVDPKNRDSIEEKAIHHLFNELDSMLLETENDSIKTRSPEELGE